WGCVFIFVRVAFPPHPFPPFATPAARLIQQLSLPPLSSSRAVTIPLITRDTQRHRPGHLCRHESHRNLSRVQYVQCPRPCECGRRDQPHPKSCRGVELDGCCAIRPSPALLWPCHSEIAF